MTKEFRDVLIVEIHTHISFNRNAMVAYFFGLSYTPPPLHPPFLAHIFGLTLILEYRLPYDLLLRSNMTDKGHLNCYTTN